MYLPVPEKFIFSYDFELQSLVLFLFLKKFLWHLLWKSLVVMNFLYFCLFENVLIFTLFLKGSLPDTVFSVDRYFFISTLNRSSHCLLAYISWFKLKNSLIILLRISFMWRVNFVTFKILCLHPLFVYNVYGMDLFGFTKIWIIELLGLVYPHIP